MIKRTEKLGTEAGVGIGVIPDLLSFLSISGENQKLMLKEVECEPSEEEGQSWKPFMDSLRTHLVRFCRLKNNKIYRIT